MVAGAPLLKAALEGGVLVLNIDYLLPGRRYMIESTLSLNPITWTFLREFEATARTVTQSINLPASQSTMFLRIRSAN